MIITINGKREEIKRQLNIAQLVLNRGLCADNLVIEHNSRIIPRHKWKDISLAENDTIEIVSFVAGG